MKVINNPKPEPKLQQISTNQTKQIPVLVRNQVINTRIKESNDHKNESIIRNWTTYKITNASSISIKHPYQKQLRKRYQPIQSLSHVDMDDN